MVHEYLGIKHEYGKFDCITIIKQFYKHELNIHFDLPDYPSSRAWIEIFFY
jgi:hypothetical protein